MKTKIKNELNKNPWTDESSIAHKVLFWFVLIAAALEAFWLLFPADLLVQIAELVHGVRWGYCPSPD